MSLEFFRVKPKNTNSAIEQQQQINTQHSQLRYETQNTNYNVSRWLMAIPNINKDVVLDETNCVANHGSVATEKGNRWVCDNDDADESEETSFEEVDSDEESVNSSDSVGSIMSMISGGIRSVGKGAVKASKKTIKGAGKLSKKALKKGKNLGKTALKKSKNLSKKAVKKGKALGKKAVKDAKKELVHTVQDEAKSAVKDAKNDLKESVKGSLKGGKRKPKEDADSSESSSESE